MGEVDCACIRPAFARVRLLPPNSARVQHSRLVPANKLHELHHMGMMQSFQGDPTSNKGQDKFEVPVPSGDLPQIDVAGASKAGVY
jgi:hypothetical protein